MTRLLMLVAAKWREFCTENPNLQEPEDETSKSVKSIMKEDIEGEEEDDEDDEDSKSSSKKRGSRSSARKNRGSKGKSKVPTLKIKIGKRKRGSSVSFDKLCFVANICFTII